MKVPKWSKNKFHDGICKIGVQMKATGESMALGMTFEEAPLKAVRGVYDNLNWMYIEKLEKLSENDLKDILKSNTSENFFIIFELIKRGLDLKEIYGICKVDYWFLNKLKNLDILNQKLKSQPLTDFL